MNIDLETANATYSDKRQKYYPTLGTQLDLLWHAIDDGVFGDNAKLTSFYTELEAVKDKYPKS
jgi:hypothetical protein